MFLIPRNGIIAGVVAGGAGMLGVVYSATVCLPVLYTFCQYRTPLSDLLYSLRKRAPRHPGNVKDAELVSPFWEAGEEGYGKGMHAVTVDALYWLVETSNKAQVHSLATQACANLLLPEDATGRFGKEYRTLRRPSLHVNSGCSDDVKEKHTRAGIVLHRPSSPFSSFNSSIGEQEKLVSTSDITLALTLAVHHTPISLLSSASASSSAASSSAPTYLPPGYALEVLVNHYTIASEMPCLPWTVWHALYATSLWRVPQAQASLGGVERSNDVSHSNNFSCSKDVSRSKDFPRLNDFSRSNDFSHSDDFSRSKEDFISNSRPNSCIPISTSQSNSASLPRSFLHLLRDAVNSHALTLLASQNQTRIADAPVPFSRYMQAHLIDAGWLCRLDGVIVNYGEGVRALVRRIPGDKTGDGDLDLGNEEGEGGGGGGEDDGLSVHAVYPDSDSLVAAAETQHPLDVTTQRCVESGL